MAKVSIPPQRDAYCIEAEEEERRERMLAEQVDLKLKALEQRLDDVAFKIEAAIRDPFQVPIGGITAEDIGVPPGPGVIKPLQVPKLEGPYIKLREELDSAYDQASIGKGKQRHADNEPFENQKICVINRWLRGARYAGPLFQAVKKTVESARMEPEAAIRELDGAINYLCAAKILLREEIENG
jgi:hypothetical protein